MSEVGRFFSARPFDYHGWEGPSTWSTGYRCQDCGSIPLCSCPECSHKLHESCPKCGCMPSEENDNDEGDEGDVDGELEDRWRDDMRDMYNMHRGWLRCQDCGGLPDFDKQCCKECEGVNFRGGILSISIDNTVALCFLRVILTRASTLCTEPTTMPMCAVTETTNSASWMCPTSSARQIQMIVHLADRTQRASAHLNL